MHNTKKVADYNDSFSGVRQGHRPCGHSLRSLKRTQERKAPPRAALRLLSRRCTSHMRHCVGSLGMSTAQCARAGPCTVGSSQARGGKTVAWTWRRVMPHACSRLNQCLGGRQNHPKSHQKPEFVWDNAAMGCALAQGGDGPGLAAMRQACGW